MVYSHIDVPLPNRLTERELPTQPVVMYQRWHELLFLHWSVLPRYVATYIPSDLSVDTFEGKAWIGIVPFTMRGVRPKFLPPLPGISNFPELNLRTYVVDKNGRPGVWFFSLDTPKRIPNWIARTFFHLNYRYTNMRVFINNESCKYQSGTSGSGNSNLSQNYEWRRLGQTFHAEPGSLEFFLVERYRLFAYSKIRKRMFTGKVHHKPYPIQRANLECYSKRLFASNKLSIPEGEPNSILSSSGVNVQIFPMKEVVYI